jgi:hypothetical protein
MSASQWERLANEAIADAAGWKARCRALEAALKRAEYLVTGQEYLDALAVIRAALAKVQS